MIGFLICIFIENDLDRGMTLMLKDFQPGTSPIISRLNNYTVMLVQRLRPLSPYIPLVLYLSSMALVWGKIVVNLNEINPWDEAAYINNGLSVISKGYIPALGGNPLVVYFYALIYLPFQHSPFWLALSCSLGRFVSFTMLWLSAYLVAKRLRSFASPLIMIGIIFAVPMFLGMIRFPSDPIFVSVAALSLWQLLAYYQERERKHLWIASLFLGFAGLTRSDGLIIFVPFVVFILVSNLSSREWWRSLVAAVVPFLILVGGYTLFYGIVTGDFSTGIPERTYENFEGGHRWVFSPSGEINPLIATRIGARSTFGTAEENQYSVFRAIARNPGVYFQRVGKVIKALPTQIWLVYGGKRFAFITFLMTLRGIIELLRRKEFHLLTIFCIWPSHYSIILITTTFRAQYFMFPFYIVFGIAAIGLTAVLKKIENRREWLLWTVIMLGLAAYGIVENILPHVFNALVFLIALWLPYIGKRIGLDIRQIHVPVALLILFAGGVMVRASFPGLKIRIFGVVAEEQAVLSMVELLEPDDVVAAGSPGVVWAAKMTYLGLSADDVPWKRTSEDFLKWMISEGTKAVYVDETLNIDNPAIWSLIEPHIGNGLERVYTGDGGNVQVLLVKTNP